MCSAREETQSARPSGARSDLVWAVSRILSCVAIYLGSGSLRSSSGTSASPCGDADTALHPGKNFAVAPPDHSGDSPVMCITGSLAFRRRAFLFASLGLPWRALPATLLRGLATCECSDFPHPPAGADGRGHVAHVCNYTTFTNKKKAALRRLPCYRIAPD